MTYHDNDVFLSMNEGYTLINGSYTVNSFSVTSGQDPDRKVYAGLVVSFGSNGKLTFRLGRKGSSDTARWFNERISTGQNTFGHTAGELNFAFLGTLKMTVKGGLLGGREETLTFLNVALAQGHSGASNNWWFGGQNCSYIQNNRVICNGTNSRGEGISFVCQRGGNDVSVVGVTPSTFVDTANWMKKLADALPLDQIMMPGSHDAGMSTLSHCAPPLVSDGYTKTQSGSIGQQLKDGSRYFDIRVDYDYGTLVTYHRTDGWGCNGQDLKAVLDQTQAFLTDHPSETAILKFSHIRNYNDHHASDTKLLINNLLNQYSAKMYVNASANINLAYVNMGSVRGKMILVFDYDEFINPATGRFRYKDGGSIQPDTNITVYDEYADTSNYEDMKANQLKKWKDYGGMGNGRLFLLSWTLTASPPGSTIETLANTANTRLPGVLYDQIVTAHASKPNIVYIDFVNGSVTQSIIMYNF
jgi:hypothetical protein